MSKIELEKPVRESLTRALSRYLKDELEVEVEGFDAVFLLDFVLDRVGPHIYNQGLRDAQRVMNAKFELIGDAIYEIEKPAKL